MYVHAARPVNPRRKKEYLKAVKEHHFDNIARLKYRIQDYDDHIARLSKGANAHLCIQPIEAEKQPFVRQLQVVEAGWNKIAESYCTESQKLFTFPRELRDKIYRYLYTRNKASLIEFPTRKCRHSMLHLDIKRRMLSTDPFLYLNATFVDPAIAAEAAQVFYDTNTFQFKHTWIDYSLPKLLKIDCFGSGVIPWDGIR